jgi:hypothetical protein
VISNLMHPPPNSVGQVVAEAFSPNAAAIVDGLLRRPSMAVAFSPMKAVHTSEGDVVAVGTFAVRPSPAQSLLVHPTDSMKEFASPQPKCGRVNSHMRFGDRGTPKVVRDAAEDGGLWVASVGQAAGGTMELTLHKKVSSAEATEEEWTEEEWTKWEAEQLAQWEAENGCYPWQFVDGANEPVPERRASLQPIGGRINTHMRFDDDSEEEEDEEEEYDYELEEVLVESRPKSVGAPTPNSAASGVSALGKLTLQSRASANGSVGGRRMSGVSAISLGSSVGSGLRSIAKSYGDADEEEVEADPASVVVDSQGNVLIHSEDEEEEEAEIDAAQLPICRLFGTPSNYTIVGVGKPNTNASAPRSARSSMGAPASVPSAFSQYSRGSHGSYQQEPPRSTHRGSSIYLPPMHITPAGPRDSLGSVSGLVLGDRTLGLGAAASVQVSVQAAPASNAPAVDEKAVQGTFTPLALHEVHLANEKEARQLLGIFTPADAPEVPCLASIDAPVAPAAAPAAAVAAQAASPQIVIHRELTGGEKTAALESVLAAAQESAMSNALAAAAAAPLPPSGPLSTARPAAVARLPSSSAKKQKTPVAFEPEEDLAAVEAVAEAVEAVMAAEEAMAAETLAEEATAGWTEDEVHEMRVVELREALGSLGLSTLGKKAQLAERLIEALKAPAPTEAAAPVEPEPAVEAVEPPISQTKAKRGAKRAAAVEAVEEPAPAEEPASVKRPRRGAKAAEVVEAPPSSRARKQPAAEAEQPPPSTKEKRGKRKAAVEEPAAPASVTRSTRSRR